MDNPEIYSRTDIGGRKVNEDSLITMKVGNLVVLAVADGMGGHAAGEVASGVVKIEIEKHFQAYSDGPDLRGEVQKVISKANREVYLLARENREYTGMGTTLVMAAISGTYALVANIGDSRAYLVSGVNITRITKDHSAVQELMDNGFIRQEEVQDHPLRSTLTRVIGVGPVVEADYYHISLEPEDILLLCSDGLNECLSDEEILSVLRSADISHACDALASLAKEKGAKDNISVIVAAEKIKKEK